MNVFFASLSTFLSSLLYIKRRTKLVLYLHSFYFTRRRYYHVLNTTQQNGQDISHVRLVTDGSRTRPM